MKPMPTDRQVEHATDLAVRATGDWISDEILMLARHESAVLALVAIMPERDWAVAVLVSPHENELAPDQLTQLIPLDQTEYIARGESWWPEPGSTRWAWVIGRVFNGDLVEVTYKGQSTRPPISPNGWFLHLRDGGHAGEEMAVRVRSTGEIDVL